MLLLSVSLSHNLKSWSSLEITEDYWRLLKNTTDY